MSAESQELQKILSDIDVSDIGSVEFFPTNGESFRLDTDNIKKLTRYITTKLEKEYFLPHELDKTYGYVIDNLYTDLPKEEYAAIRKQMKIFIEQGGKVEIHTQPVGKGIQTPVQKKHSNTGGSIQIFISMIIIIFGATFALCGATFFGPKDMFTPEDPMLGSSMILGAIVLMSFGLWVVEKNKSKFYHYVIFASFVALVVFLVVNG